uniref:FZ domain-containing protein n=1 Tax=Sus scrofa TaxID=9823 RepID=A0A8D2BT49_PIG
ATQAQVFLSLWIAIGAGLRGAPDEGFKIMMQRQAPSHLTSPPNYLHHSSQQFFILATEVYQNILDLGCCATLRLFLCDMHAHISSIEFLHDPSRVCTYTTAHGNTMCKENMRNYNLKWPSFLNLIELPILAKGSCVPPKSILTKMPQRTTKFTNCTSAMRSQVRSQSLDLQNFKLQKCQCRKDKETLKTVLCKVYSMVISGHFKTRQRMRCKKPPNVVDRKEVFAYISPIPPKPHSPLLFDSNCSCSKVLFHQD